MITYKGSPLVKGKHFIYEGKTVEYQGKIFGDKHSFKLDETEIILDENQATALKSLLEHSLLSEQDNADDLYQLVSSYTDEQLKIAREAPSNKVWQQLLNSMQEELNKLSDLGLSYKTSVNPVDNMNKSYLLEMILDFLEETQRNISETSLPNIYSQLNNFIYNIKKVAGDK